MATILQTALYVCIFLKEKFHILTKISQKSVFMGQIDNNLW